MSPFIALVARLVREEEGQDLVEYAMLVALIAVIAMVGVRALGVRIDAFFAGLPAALGF